MTSAGVSVIVLAGGRSSRFGSPKLEAPLDGRPLLDHAIDLARELSDDVVVALPPDMSDTAAFPEGVRDVPDRDAFGGPLVGLASAIAAVDRPILIVLAGDMPRLSVAIVQAMLIVMGQQDRLEAVVLERDRAPRPLPLVLRTAAARRAIGAILERDRERSLRAVLAELETHVVDESRWRPLDPEGDSLADVDRTEDLAALEGRVRASDRPNRRLR